MTTLVDPALHVAAPPPYRGKVVGKLCQLLSLGGDTEGRPKRGRGGTRQRYRQDLLPGGEVETELVAGLVECLVPASMRKQVQEPVLDELARAVPDLLLAWDKDVADAWAGAPHPADPFLSAWPFLRFLVLDVGIRWGAWEVLQGRGLARDFCPWWLGDNVFTTFLQRQVGIEKQDAFSRRFQFSEPPRCPGVSPERVKDWFRGVHEPRDEHIVWLAEQLSGNNREVPLKELQVRAALALDRARAQMKVCDHLVGYHLVEDWTDALQTTARLAATHLLRQEAETSTLRDLVVHGSRADVGPALCEALAARSVGRPEVARDLRVLHGNRVPRLKHWLEIMVLAEDLKGGDLAAFLGAPRTDRQSRATDRLLRVHKLRMSGYAKPLAEVIENDKDAASVKNLWTNFSPKAVEAALLWHEACSARQAGDLDGALPGLRRCLELQPDNVGTLMELAGVLHDKELFTRIRFSDEVHDLLHRAAALEKVSPAPFVLLGRVLATEGRDEEASEAFRNASAKVRKPYVPLLQYRGLAHVWAGRLREGVADLQRALQEDPANQQVRGALALTLALRERSRASRAVLTSFLRRTPTDLLDGLAPRLLLRYWPQVRLWLVLQNWVVLHLGLGRPR